MAARLFRSPAALLLAASVTLAANPGAVRADPQIQEALDEAARLSVTAPWMEAEALLETLEPRITDATPRQRNWFELLRARHEAMDGQHDAALARLERIRHGPMDPDHRLRSLELSANINLESGRFEAAFSYFRRALELLPKVDEPRHAATLLGLVASALSRVGESSQALDYADRALDRARRAGLERETCFALVARAVAVQASGDLENAETAWRVALEQCREAGDPLYIASCQVSLGTTLVDLGRSDDALEWLEEGVDAAREAGFRNGVIRGRLALARGLVEMGRVREAREILVELEGVFEESGYYQELEQVHRSLARLAEMEGDSEAALGHYRRANSARDRFLDRDRTMRLAYLQVEFDTLQREQELALLRERARVDELEEQTRLQRRRLLTGGLVALAIIGFLLAAMLVRVRADRRHFRWLSEHDSLTGLYNHSTFFRRAEEAFARARDGGERFCMLVADVDYFKRVNDEYGHAAGDRTLRRVAACLLEVFGKSGVTGRIGGEEFAVALPGCGGARARDLVMQFNQRLDELADMDFRITLSFGLVESEAGAGGSAEELRRAADRALYEAKKGGRNRLVEAGRGGD